MSHGLHGAPLPAPRHTTISQHYMQQGYVVKTKIYYQYLLGGLVHDASLMHHTDIFATAAKAATNMVPALHPPQHQTKTVHTGDAFLPRRRRKVPGGGENSPPQSNLFGADRAWCYVVTHSAISRPHPALNPYQQRVQTMN